MNLILFCSILWCFDVFLLIEKSWKQVKTAINTAMVYTYYGIGRYIVEDEQNGYERAAYGKKVLKQLSEQLCAKYGNGWSYSNLRQIRQFYMVIWQTLFVKIKITSQVLHFHGHITWFLCVSRILTNVTSMRLSVGNKIGACDSFNVSMPPVFTNVLPLAVTRLK